jgi:hypothetical protein
MPFLLSFLLFSFFSLDDLGNRGTYEVNIETTSGEKLHLFLNVATYDRLDTIFESNAKFKEFLVNMQGYEDIEAFKFYKKAYYLEYPKYSFNNLEKEKLRATLPEDRVTLQIEKITVIEYLGFQKRNTYCSLGTQLSKEEIFFLQEKPYFSKGISIDIKHENYHDLHFISYNKSLSQAKLQEMYLGIKKEYYMATTNCTKSETSYIYSDFLKVKQNELKEHQILLLLVWNP